MTIITGIPTSTFEAVVGPSSSTPLDNVSDDDPWDPQVAFHSQLQNNPADVAYEKDSDFCTPRFIDSMESKMEECDKAKKEEVCTIPFHIGLRPKVHRLDLLKIIVADDPFGAANDVMKLYMKKTKKCQRRDGT